MNTVLFLGKADASAGGQETQLQQTAKALSKRKWKVVFSQKEPFDLVHIFNHSNANQTLEYFKLAVQFRKPILFSTVFWDQLEIRTDAHDAVGYTAHFLPVYQRCVRMADWLLPNGEGEMRCVEKVMGMKRKYSIVVNGVSEELFEVPLQKQKDEIVFCAGRIENRKNQVRLAKACHELGVELVCAGQVCDRRMLDALHAFPKVKLLGYIAPSQLWIWMTRAKVYAQPSYYETPGIATLEAGALGCRLVCGKVGLAEEYLGERALYCEHKSVESIKHAIAQAMESEEDEEAIRERRAYIQSHYTWDVAAKQTISAYRKCLRA